MILLFDLDGVVTSAKMFSEGLAKEFGIRKGITDEFFEKEFKRCRTGKADLKKVIEPYLKEWKWNGTVDELLEYWFTYEHEMDQKMVDEIKKLRQRGIRCYAVTDQEKYRAAYLRKEMGMEKLFDEVFVSAELGYSKSEQEFFEKVYKKIAPNKETPKNKIVMWDDDKKNVETAKRFGIEAFYFTDYKQFKKELETALSAAKD